MWAAIAFKSRLQQKQTRHFIDSITVSANVVSTVVTQRNVEEGTTRKTSDATPAGIMYEIYCSGCRATDAGLGVEDVDVMTVIGKHC